MEALVHALLLEKEYVEFLVGRDGDFDQIVSSAVKRQKRIVRDDNSSLIWILPYPTAELRNNMENFEDAIAKSLDRTAVWKIRIENLTGKRKKYDKSGEEMKFGRME